MSVDMRWYVPPFAHIDDVARVLGVTLGLPHEMKSLNTAGLTRSGHDAWALAVPRAFVHLTSVVQLASIILPAERETYRMSYSFEVDGPQGGWDSQYAPGSKLVVADYTRTMAAALTNACHLFGGTIDYYDSDESYNDLIVPARYDFTPSDGYAWQQWQYEMAGVALVTEEQKAGPWPVEFEE